MTMLRFAVAAFALITVALTVASLAFPKKGHYAVESGGNTIAIGILQTCTDGTTSSCEWNKGREAGVTGQCTRTSSNVGARLYTIMILSFLGALLALLAVGASIPHVRPAAIARIVLMAFSFLCIGICAGLFYMTVFWLYCDASKLCDALQLTDCSESFTLYFWLLAAAAACSLVGTIIAIPALSQTKAVPPVEGNEPTAADNGEYAEGDDTKVGVEGDEAGGEEGYDEEDEGDWEWQEEYQMYWSESGGMYLEPDSGWYYDPESGWWYDPETEEWIEPEYEEGEEEEG